jgi:hypothetical protein
MSCGVSSWNKSLHPLLPNLPSGWSAIAHPVQAAGLFTHRGITIQPYNQNITKRTRGVEQMNMPRVQQVEAAVGEYHFRRSATS